MQIRLESSSKPTMGLLIELLFSDRNWGFVLQKLKEASEAYIAGRAVDVVDSLRRAMERVHGFGLGAKRDTTCGITITRKRLEIAVFYSTAENVWVVSVNTDHESAEEEVQRALDILETLVDDQRLDPVRASASWDLHGNLFHYADGEEEYSGGIVAVHDALVDMLARIDPSAVAD